jgi:hypothetical protein
MDNCIFQKRFCSRFFGAKALEFWLVRILVRRRDFLVNLANLPFLHYDFSQNTARFIRGS